MQKIKQKYILFLIAGLFLFCRALPASADAVQTYNATINLDGTGADIKFDCIYGQNSESWALIYTNGITYTYIEGGAGSGAVCNNGYVDLNFGNFPYYTSHHLGGINGNIGNYYIFYNTNSSFPYHCTYPYQSSWGIDGCMAGMYQYAIFSQTATPPDKHWTTTPAPPTSPTLFIDTPASGTTITDNSTTLSGSYAALHIGTLGYGYLHIRFKNPNNGIYSYPYTIPLSNYEGTFSTPLSNFGITENGEWDLIADQELDANTFVELTPDPAYTLNFDIGGNSIPYTFTNWNTWYPENAAGGYTVPSDFADSIEGFFEPIFTNAYEFANQTLRYFNADTSYAKGNQVGIMFPTTQAYINKINIFFGGFPLIQFFEFAIVVMLGVFIVRTIFKFIPFFG
ncbi:MAG: hypothetical protein RBT06_07665 [Smithellaceae bacterium]|jgi:hypothetical protein|nr:hypothetical protein [Smithellaceae bacterium]